MDAEKSSTLLGVRIMLRGQLEIYSGEHLTIITHSKTTFLMSLNETTLLIMDWHKDLYVNKARNGFSKRLMTMVSTCASFMALKIDMH